MTHKSDAYIEYVQAIRDLKVLPDRAATGQLRGPGEYGAEWERLDTARRKAAAQLSVEELREAYARAQYAC
jgi:hypothetical protein